MDLIGEVEGKHVILVDDMVDTAGTLTKASEIMMEKGALSVRAVCTHAILSGNAMEEIIVTDSIPHNLEGTKKIHVLSCAKLFADVMHSVHQHVSISDKFIM